MRIKIVLPIAAILAVFAAVAFAEMSKTGPAPHHPPSIQSEVGAMGALSGKVTETMSAGGYTYVCLEKDGVKTWVAMPETKVVVGQALAVKPGQVMQNFRSKSLNRTFESIVFSGGPAEAGAPVAVAGAAASGRPQAAPMEKNVKVGKASGPNAYRISEIYAKRSKLDNKEVTVKGKVVKVSKAIMQRNWIHIQDGTGDQKKGTHELVVTSRDLPAVGDIVTVKGTFAKDKDFGAGYLYPAIIENAKISK